MKKCVERSGIVLWISVCMGLTGVVYAASPVKEDYKSATINFAQGSPVTSGVYDKTDPYSIGLDPWVANLVPARPVYVRSSASFFNVLSAAFTGAQGWSFASAATELSNDSLVVRTYDVQGTAARVGAEFHVEYVPKGTDPTANVHWIQVISDNHNVTNNPGHGNAENIVDTATTSPYYDSGFAATSREFYDFPGRTDANKSHNWDAILFLVTGPAIGTPGLVTFYGGIQWGWENHPILAAPVPEPETYAMLLAGLGLLGLARRRKQSAT